MASQSRCSNDGMCEWSADCSLPIVYKTRVSSLKRFRFSPTNCKNKNRNSENALKPHPTQTSLYQPAIMQLGTALTFLTLTPIAFSFKIRAFSGDKCTGSAKEINIWDNSCRTTSLPTTRSFRVLAYGAHRQRATFYGAPACYPNKNEKDWWADGGSNVFKKGDCVSLYFNAKAYGSRSA